MSLADELRNAEAKLAAMVETRLDILIEYSVNSLARADGLGFAHRGGSNLLSQQDAVEPFMTWAREHRAIRRDGKRGSPLNFARSSQRMRRRSSNR